MNRREAVEEYHQRTKHHPGRYAASLGYMDWATQPDPYRNYTSAPVVPLPLPDERGAITYGELFKEHEAAPLSMESLSVMLRFGLGLAAVKCMGQECWALRCNASSGNLHPTEGYVILPPIEGISSRTVLAHYAPKTHQLEILHSFETDVWHTLETGTFLFGITSIVWREAWKYGERAFRYTQLDAGHALRSASVAAMLNGWDSQIVTPLSGETLDALLGVDQTERYLPYEEEIADALMIVAPSNVDVPASLLSQLRQDMQAPFAGTANQLSPSHHPWEAISIVEQATRDDLALLPAKSEAPVQRDCSTEATSVIINRRSAREMDFNRSRILFSELQQILSSARKAFGSVENACSLVLFIHDVDGIEPGLYLYLLNPDYLDALRGAMRASYVFDPVDDHLYLLETGDFRMQAKHISCTQDIAADGAFSLGMLCEFAQQLEKYGASRYKSLYWECGAIGQQLYLEATSLGLSATGIGCFLDDVMHRLLGLEDDVFQSLYHFTIGRAIPDLRLQTLKPYSRR